MKKQHRTGQRRPPTPIPVVNRGGACHRHSAVGKDQQTSVVRGEAAAAAVQGLDSISFSSIAPDAGKTTLAASYLEARVRPPMVSTRRDRCRPRCAFPHLRRAGEPLVRAETLREFGIGDRAELRISPGSLTSSRGPSLWFLTTSRISRRTPKSRNRLQWPPMGCAPDKDPGPEPCPRAFARAERGLALLRWEQQRTRRGNAPGRIVRLEQDRDSLRRALCPVHSPRVWSRSQGISPASRSTASRRPSADAHRGAHHILQPGMCRGF